MMFGQSSSAKLQRLLQQYEQQLQRLESLSLPTPQDILRVLLLRDDIRKTVQNRQGLSPSLVQKLTRCDQRLQQYKDHITPLDDYYQWAKVVPTSDESWWWRWEAAISQKWWQKLDWFWNLLTLISWGISTSLIIDAVPRILSGGIDQFSALSIIIPSFLALLTTGKLTPIGEQLLNSIVKNYQSKKIFIFVLSLGLVISLVIIHENYNQISRYFNTQGEKYYKADQLDEALSNYKRAIAFDPDNGEAHYNLGILYEDLQQVEQAKLEYKIAGEQGSLLIRLQAYNNLGRLFLLEKKYQDAIFPLLEGYNAIDEDDEAFKRLKYSLYKNLGWANLGLKNYVEAKLLLNQAKSLDQEQGAAYCLLAQVLERQNNEQEALKYWNDCIAYGNNRNPEEYLWVSIARGKVR